MLAKFGRRELRWNALVAFVLTFVEALLTILLVRFVYRSIMRGVGMVFGRRGAALMPAGPVDLQGQPVLQQKGT